MIPKTILEICELFDATICSDWAMYQKKEQPCFYIGQTNDRSAGLWGFQLTPTFFSRAALERYCKSQKGRDEINQRASETFCGWDDEKRCWPDP